MKPKEFEVIYKFTVAPTVPFPSTLNWNTEPIGELIRCKDCKYYEEQDETIGTCLLTVSGAHIKGYCAWAERKDNGNR